MKKKRKYLEKYMKMNNISLKENLENGVKRLEFFYKRTNSEYYHEVNKNNTPIEIGGSIAYLIDDKENESEKLPRFIPWETDNQIIHTNTIEKKIKEILGILLKSSIRYDRVKCSRNCERKHDNHYYFYAYWWNRTLKKLKKKYIGKHLPVPYEMIELIN